VLQRHACVPSLPLRRPPCALCYKVSWCALTLRSVPCRKSCVRSAVWRRLRRACALGRSTADEPCCPPAPRRSPARGRPQRRCSRPVGAFMRRCGRRCCGRNTQAQDGAALLAQAGSGCFGATAACDAVSSARPATAAASVSPSRALSSADESMAEESFAQESSAPAGASSAAGDGSSGSQTARSFLKRRSQKTAPAPRVDWKAVARPRVDAKHEEGSYLGPSSLHNPVYESATGREWDERDRAEAGWMPAGGAGRARVAVTPLALPAEQQTHRPAHRKTPSGSQTARSAPREQAPPKVFRPAGFTGAVLPIVANTDSGAPPLSSLGSVGATCVTAAENRRGSKCAVAGRGQRRWVY